MLRALSDHFLIVFAALFPIINPPGTALLFLALTRHLQKQDRALLAKWVAIYSSIIMAVSLAIGSSFLQLFGISVPILRIAGGLVVTLSGWQLLRAPASGPVAGGVSTGDGTDLKQFAFYPLTLPLTTGPGTIAVTIALSTGRSQRADMTSYALGSLAAVLAMGLLIFVSYRFADRIGSALGKSGTDALARLFAFILICIGVQLFWSGFTEAWLSLPAR
jgi:multiple antibiotic resistance protein